MLSKKIQLGFSYFRLTELCNQLKWSPQTYLCSGKFGLPIIWKRNNKIIAMTYSGSILFEIPYTANIRYAFWNKKTELVAIDDNSKFRVFDSKGVLLREYTFPGRIKTVDNPNQLYVMTEKHELWQVDDDKFETILIAKFPSRPISWVILNSSIVVSENQKNLVWHHQWTSLKCLNQIILKMVVSPNQKFIACFTIDGNVTVITLDQKIINIPTSHKMPPTQMIWYENYYVFVYWADDKSLLIMDLNQNYQTYDFESDIRLVPTVDGLHILSESKHNFVQLIPDLINRFYQIGSLTPGAILYESWKQFTAGSSKASYYLNSIKSKLHQACDECLYVASRELDLEQQKILLNTVSYGKTYVQATNPNEFKNVCYRLRVLNTLRQCGIPVTFDEMEYLTVEKLIKLLVRRKQYQLSFAICRYLNYDDKYLVQQWLRNYNL